MKNLIYILIVLSTLFSFSCSNEKKNQTNNIEFKKYEADSIYYLFGDTSKPSIKIQIGMNYPVKYQHAPILDSIQKLVINNVVNSLQGFVIDSITTNKKNISDNPQKAIQTLVQELVSGYQSFENKYKNEILNEQEEPLASFFNEYICKENNVFNKDEIFCFSTNTYSFSGGAHGIGMLKYICVNLKNGSVITNKDLFIDDYESLLSPLILEKLAEKNHVKTPKDLEENGFFDIADIKPNNNFFLNEKGITYVYNPYEIAAYAIGISEVFIPYGDITFILSPNSLIKRFL